jgi:hypothetical protein
MYAGDMALASPLDDLCLQSEGRSMTDWIQCEFTIGAKCTLTGKGCLCEEDFKECTRRRYALDYETRHHLRIGSKVQVVCSEDNPKPPPQGT